MAEVDKKEENTTTEDVNKTPASSTENTEQKAEVKNGGERKDYTRAPRQRNQRSPRRSRKPRARVRSEFDQKIISIRRVTRVVAGGRRFSFSVAVVIGDKKGSVGVGIGKASDTALAIDKAVRNAKKNMVKIKTTKTMGILHDVEAKHASSVVKILPAPGKGVAAGSSVRTVLELAGIKNVTAKVLSRSKNKLNNAQVTIKALEELKA
jgi:small subunit ribosomal protein S5